MAQVKDLDTATVDPSVAAPDQSLRVQATPDMFGGAIGEAVAKLGQQAQKTGEYFGQVQTDDAMNGAMDRVNGVLSKYRTLQGREALDARKGVEDEIDDIFKTGRAGLKLGYQQTAYDNAARGYRTRYIDGLIANHAEQAARVYTKNTNENSLNVALAGVSNVSDDDEHVEIFKEDARRAMVRQAVSEGNAGDPEAINFAISAADRSVYKTQVQSVAVKDPVRALALAERHREALGTEYPELANSLRARVNEAEGLSIANDAIGTAATRMQELPPAQANAPAVRQAILDIESGDKSTAPVSVDGAVGPAQMLPKTFEQFAKPGEDINNPADNRAVSARYIEHLSNLPNVQGDPARIAVGYFSGEGNIAPIGSPQPWVANKTDGNGKSTQAYVQDVTSRMQNQGAMLAAKASAYDVVLAKTSNNPQARQVALTEINRQYSAAQTAALANDAARKAQTEAKLRDYGDKIRAGQPVDFLRDPDLTETQVEHLHTLQMQTIAERLNGAPGNYGPGAEAVRERIYSSGPDRIVNVEQLLPMVASGQLNPTGYTWASSMLAEVNKPGAEADRQITSNFYEAARKKVTLEVAGAFTKIIRPERQEAWNKALPVLNQAIAEGRAKGLTNAQMMDPNNKDSVWGALKPFLPTPAESKNAQIAQDAEAARAAAPDLSTPAGLKAWVRANPQERRAEGERIAIEKGWIRSPSGPPVPQGEKPAPPPDVHDLLVPANSPDANTATWGKRRDGSEKGMGFLGLLKNARGGVSSELAVTVNLDGKDIDIPTLVPTLTRQEVETMLNLPQGQPVPREIIDKAVEFARPRVAAGKSPFAGPDESPK